MKRRRLSISSTTTEDEFLYAVFESYDEGGVSRYIVYKVDHSSAMAAGNDALPELGQPIWFSDPSDSNVRIAREMIVFSAGSIIYFVGGRRDYKDYQPEGFCLDLDNSNSSPAGEWESLPLPLSNEDIKSYFFGHLPRSYFLGHRHHPMLDIKATAVCDSNICISIDEGPIFVFVTKSRTWHILDWPNPTMYGSLTLPFYGVAQSLIVGNQKMVFNMGSPLVKVFRVYECPYAPVDENLKMPAWDDSTGPFLFNPIGFEGVEGLEEYLMKLGHYKQVDDKPDMQFWSFNNKPARICIVNSRYSLIHICDLSLVEGDEFNVIKLANTTVTYKHRDRRYMKPRHFLFAS